MKLFGSLFGEPTEAEKLAEKQPSRASSTFQRGKTIIMCPFNKLKEVLK